MHCHLRFRSSHPRIVPKLSNFSLFLVLLLSALVTSAIFFSSPTPINPQKRNPSSSSDPIRCPLNLLKISRRRRRSDVPRHRRCFPSQPTTPSSPSSILLTPRSWVSPKNPSFLQSLSIPTALLTVHDFEPKKSRFASSVKSPSRWPIAVFDLSSEDVSGSREKDLPGQPSFDAVLSAVEVLCIVPPAIYSIGCLIGSVLPPAVAKQFQASAGNKLFVWQHFLLVGALEIGCLIRWRQWRRLYRVNGSGVSVDLIGRIEKVEEDLRSSTTIICVLSRQLEKLGIRFRVSRKALKELIAETAALAQKNSEATRALAMQEDILEKELGEIQKVLLAMQEQQQKQLELILAIGKAGKLLLDGKRESALEEGNTVAATPIPEKRGRKSSRCSLK
uniref:Uncharacterized protein n=1 Tax=Ananas comosus var. bracteatus TaxID=296719 RepID=A0A6V7P660_ANACO|nr:unnamed protein product [Ananas comosus var. bracteatus]